MLSLEDELSVLDLRYADLLQSVQKLSGCDDEDAEVCHTTLNVESLCSTNRARYGGFSKSIKLCTPPTSHFVADGNAWTLGCKETYIHGPPCITCLTEKGTETAMCAGSCCVCVGDSCHARSALHVSQMLYILLSTHCTHLSSVQT